MMQARSTYGPGTSSTEVTGVPTFPSGGPRIDPNALAQLQALMGQERSTLQQQLPQREAYGQKEYQLMMLKLAAEEAAIRRADAAARQAPISFQREARGIAEDAVTPQQEPNEAHWRFVARDQARQKNEMALDAAAAEQEAMQSVAPTRQVEGAGIVSGRTLDPMRMTGIQRRAFLPDQGISRGGLENDRTPGGDIALADPMEMNSPTGRPSSGIYTTRGYPVGQNPNVWNPQQQLRNRNNREAQ